MDVKDLKRFFENKSKDHHYIPQFLSRAFADNNGMLYVYDKKKKEMLKKQRPPKSMFFEQERNTILIQGKKSSVIEDETYKLVDTLCSRVIKKYQELDLKAIDFKDEDTALIFFFLITLYWRIPYSDFAAQDALNRSTILGLGSNEDMFRNEDFTKKWFRNALFDHHIKEIISKSKNINQWANVHSFEDETFILGDFPFVPEVMTNVYSEFNDYNILFALSSNRVFSRINQEEYKINFNEAMRYNAAIIQHSKKYVVSGNLELLSESVNYYERLVKNGYIFSINRLVFDKTIN